MTGGPASQVQYHNEGSRPESQLVQAKAIEPLFARFRSAAFSFAPPVNSNMEKIRAHESEQDSSSSVGVRECPTD
jgi:hypothetical protein